MRTGRTLGYTIFEGYFVSYHTAAPPSDDEWHEQLKDIAGRLKDLRGVLVVTDGGGPNVVQRRQLAELFEGRVLPVAVVTDSAVARGILVALSWLGLKQRAFSQADVGKALEFLCISGPLLPAITRTIERLRADVTDASKRAGNDS